MDLIIGISLIILASVLLIKWRYTFWTRNAVVQLPPTFPFGNNAKGVKGNIPVELVSVDFYKELKAKKLSHGGVYNMFTPIWVPIDRELIKTITLVDFAHFTDHGAIYHHATEPFTNHLFSQEGEPWRNTRTKLTPTFTSGKIKHMFGIVLQYAETLRDIVNDHANNNMPMDVKDILSCYTTDIISNCAFGLDANCLKNPNNEFRKVGKKLFQVSLLKRIIENLFPWKLLANIGYKHLAGEVQSFYQNIFDQTIEQRESKKIQRNDFVQMMLQLKNQGKLNDTLDVSKIGEGVIDLDTLYANMFVLYIAGTDTTSSTLAFVLYEISKLPDVQNKLREEIRTVLKNNNDKLNYDALAGMKYAEKVINETLRKYPTLPGLPRICTKTYKVPNSNATVPKGTVVIIPCLGIQMDPEIFPDPEKFDPERFSEENKTNRLPFSWFPFGDGPRQCIGRRFAYMTMKVALTYLLKDHTFVFGGKPERITLEVTPELTLGMKEDVLLSVRKVS